MCFIKIRKGDSDAKVNSKERINTMENIERKFIMSKRIKKVISLVLIFMIAMLQTLSTFAASGGGNKFEIVDSEYVSDVNASNGWAGMTYSSGKIELNTYYMSGYSNSKKQNVATHELGHALGLDHSTSTDVMDAAITGHTSTQALSQNDKDSYDAAYNNY